MTSETSPVQLARLEERLSALVAEFALLRMDRKEEKEHVERVAASLNEISHRLKKVEDQVTLSAPTIQEFVTIRTKVAGAGIIGKWLWIGAAGLIGFIAGNREALAHFFGRS